MKRITSNQVFHRTALLTEARAFSFARCIQGNALFQSVTVEISDRAKSEKRYFVQYQPTSTARQLDLLQGQMDAREQRAQGQAGNYRLVAGYVWNLTSGDVYETTEHTCDCPDHTFRGAVVGPCKHIRMVRTGLVAPLETEAAPLPEMVERSSPVPVMDPERRARAIADRALWD